jgi:hypothetical protein
VRALRLPSLLLPVLVLAGLGAVTVPPPAPAPVLAATGDYQPSLPINATFFYPTEVRPASKVHPSKAVDYNDVEVIARQVDEMQYAGQTAGIYSWFGRGGFSDRVFPNHLRAADDTSFRWALLDENEGVSGPNGGDPTVTQIRADLDHIYSRYAKDPSYLRIGGKPVLFAYGDAGDTCNAAARWRTADSLNRFYIVLKNVPGYTGCSPQPQGWYGYAPANGHFQVGSASYAVSPGFNKVGESAARLGRSVSRFTSDLRAMKAANVRWRLTTTWNEWSEATGTESAAEWATSSGHGAYVDAMHYVLGNAPNVPATPAVLSTSTSGQSVNLSWSSVAYASGYQVFRNGCLVTTVAGTSWTDTALTDASASYFVKAVNVRGTSRRGPVRIGVAGTPAPAPVPAGEGLVAVPGTRIMASSSGAGVGCAGLQRGQSLLQLPPSVPADATAVVLGLTTTGSQGNGTLQVHPAGSAPTAVHQLRYYSSRPASTTTVVPIGTARQLVLTENGAATHVYVDLLGWAVPGAGSLTASSSQRFLDTRTGLGGVPTGKVSGTLTAALPSSVPAGVTAVQVRLMTTGATAPGSAIAFTGGTTRPAITSLAYAPAVTMTGSVLVPVTAGRTVSVYLSSPTTLVAGIEGWVTPTGSHPLTAQAPTRLFASAARQTAVNVTLPAETRGKAALGSVGVASALGYGNLSVTPDGQSAPVIQTVSYGPQQPQSGFLWVWVPANGVLHVTLSSGALTFVDLLGVA